MFRRYAANTTTKAIKKALEKEAAAKEALLTNAEVKVEAPKAPAQPFNPRSFLAGWIGGGVFAFAYDYFTTTTKLTEKNYELEDQNRRLEYRLSDTSHELTAKTNAVDRYSSENKSLRAQLDEATAKNISLVEEQDQIRSVLMKK